MRSLRTRPWRSAHRCRDRLQRCPRTKKAARRPANASKACSRSGLLHADPDSSLADKLTGNFAAVFNECDFDMVYFDASDGTLDAYLDNWYYQNKLHLGFYRKFKGHCSVRPVAEPARAWCGTSFPATHGPTATEISSDISTSDYRACWAWKPISLGRTLGWYYMYTDVHADEIEYVCAKTIGLDGSISIETSQDAMVKHQCPANDGDAGPLRRMPAGRVLPENVQAILRKPAKDLETGRTARLETLPPGTEDPPGTWRPSTAGRRVDDHQRTVRGSPALRGDCLRLPQSAHGDYDRPERQEPLTASTKRLRTRQSAHNRLEPRFFGAGGAGVTLGEAAGASREGVEMHSIGSAETPRWATAEGVGCRTPARGADGAPRSAAFPGPGFGPLSSGRSLGGGRWRRGNALVHSATRPAVLQTGPC